MKNAIFVLLAVLAAWAQGADPYVGYIYPCGLQAGTTNRLIVGGQFLKNVYAGTISGGGAKILDVEQVPNFPATSGSQFRYLAGWLDAIAKGDRSTPPIPANPKAHVDEWRSNRWWRVLGTLDEQKLSIVERALFVRRNPLQASPSLNQRLLVTVAVDADAEPGARELRLFAQNGMSAPRPLLVTSAPHTEEARYAPPHRPRPSAPAVTVLPRVLDGQIMPGETDTWTLRLKKGRTITLRTVARELQPYIGDAVPGFFNPAIRIVDPAGAEAAFADDYFYHPDPVLVFTPPDDGDYRLEIHDLLYRGREDFVYSVTVESGARPVDPRRVSLWPNPVPQPPPDIPCRVFTDTIARAGVPQEHLFNVEEAGEYVFDLLARRVGLPLDARVSVFPVQGGRPLAVFADTTNLVFRGSIIQGECDPVGICRLAAGTYRLRVEDETGKGGPAWSYTLRVYRSAPSFEVWTAKSSFAFRAWNRSPAVNVYVVRHGGFDGPVKLLETPGFRFDPSVIPAGTNVLKVALIAQQSAFPYVLEPQFEASAEITGRTQTVRIQPADEYNQAFAWNHLLPARAFAVRIWPRGKR
ncbi:MAG: hypothetical protein J5985_00335 [Kiritimatiellae bacterium]|nr:hypothetical protein [Kiritimatiellia bacterium]